MVSTSYGNEYVYAGPEGGPETTVLREHALVIVSLISRGTRDCFIAEKISGVIKMRT